MSEEEEPPLFFKSCETNDIQYVQRHLPSLPSLLLNSRSFHGFGFTCLVVASWCGNREIVELLLADPRTDLSLTDNAGRNALHWALKKQHFDIAALLIRSSPSLVHSFDIYKMSALHYATWHGHLHTCKLILQSNYQGPIPVDICLNQCHHQLIDLFYDYSPKAFETSDTAKTLDKYVHDLQQAEAKRQPLSDLLARKYLTVQCLLSKSNSLRFGLYLWKRGMLFLSFDLFPKLPRA